MQLQQLFSRKMRRYVKDRAPRENISVDRLVLTRLRHSPMAMASIGVVVLFTLIAILGYLITPDQTPHCNQQYLELTTMKPMECATFVCIDEGIEQEKITWFQKMLNGEPLPYRAIPIYSHREMGDSIAVESYTGSTPNDGEQLVFAKSQVVKIEKRRYILGTDRYGRDLLSQIMIGTRVSLSVGFIAIAIALLIGVTLGAIAAYYGRWVDSLIQWLINVVWSIPTVLLVIAITFALGKGFWQVFVAVGLTMWVDIARVVRGQVLSIKEKEYVEAALALGFKTPKIILRHILPNILGPLIVVSASNFASAILLEAGLSFLGIGVQPPMPSWGTMVKENYCYILLDNAYLALLPGLAIMLIVLAFMIFGNELRDTLDIKNQ